MTKINNVFITVVILGIMVAGVSGCQKKEGPMEKAGQKIDNAVEKTGEQINKATVKTGEALEKTGDKIKESVK